MGIVEQFNNRPRGRRQRKRGWAWTALFALIGLAFLWFGYSYLSSGPDAGRSNTISIKKPATRADRRAKSIVSQRTFVLLGVDVNEGKKTVKGVLELVYDPARNKISGLLIDPSTYVSVPGRGFESINEGLVEGAKNLAAGVSEMVGVKAEGYAVVKGDVFTDIVDNKKPGDIFSRMDEGSVSGGRAAKLSGDLGNIPQARVTFVPLPVKNIIIGEQTYFEPNKADLKRIVMSFWGKQPAAAETATRVIILNGSGAPGIARAAADRLIGKGFKILDLKNADKFTYARTEIMVYDKKLKARGETVAKSLGTGAVIEKEATQDVTDIVIVIGKDFH